MSEPGFKKWYVTECSTSDCWCRCIGTDPDSDDMEDCIVPSGSIHRADAEQVVAEHNERPDLLKTIADLRRELAEAKEQIAELEEEESQTTRVITSTRNLAAEKMREANAERDAARAEAGRLREVCHEAWVDIGQWCQLARYQREKMDQNLGWCPTQAGIDASTAVKEKISAALATPAADAGDVRATLASLKADGYAVHSLAADAIGEVRP